LEVFPIISSMDKPDINIYFGIKFPSEFPMTDEESYQLALFLFGNPYTTYDESKRIINNISHFPSPQYVLRTLRQELLKIVETPDKNEEFLLTGFKNKYLDWFRFNIFPEKDEIIEVSKILGFPKEKILAVILDWLILSDLQIIRMKEFILKYYEMLTEEEIDKVLDKYNHGINRIIQNICDENGVQLHLEYLRSTAESS